MESQHDHTNIFPSSYVLSILVASDVENLKMKILNFFVIMPRQLVRADEVYALLRSAGYIRLKTFLTHV